MGFCLYSEQPIHNPDEPAKYWQKEKKKKNCCCLVLIYSNDLYH